MDNGENASEIISAFRGGVYRPNNRETKEIDSDFGDSGNPAPCQTVN
jgi:hypothetical protein